MKQELIESALKLTWKSIDDMEVVLPRTMLPKTFSIEKFCYYLLSPEFIEKYVEKVNFFTYDKYVYLLEMAEAISEYQSWNEQPLISLLEKIWD